MLGPEIPAKSLAPAQNGDQQSTSLIEALKQKLTGELQDDNRRVCGSALSAIAQQYEDAYESNSLQATAEKFYRARQYAPSPVHETLASLPFPLIVTTNPDDLLTQAFKAANKTPISQRYHPRGDKRANPEFVIPGSPAAPVIYHLFGDANEPSSLVLSENDMLDFLIAVISGSSPLPNSLLSALKRKGQSFLFLGFGVRRWELRMLLKILLKTWGQDQSNPIAAEPLRGLLDSDCEEMILFYQRGTRVEIEDTDIGDFLTEISRRLQAEGGYAGQAAPLGTRPRVFISYAREDSDLGSRVFSALEKEYFDPWLDTQNLSGGVDWNPQIESEIASTDFVLVLYTQAFCDKTKNYVNKEVALAADRAQYFRGPFLIPLRTFDIRPEDRVQTLAKYNEMQLRPDAFDEDISKLISTMRREYQLRSR